MESFNDSGNQADFSFLPGQLHLLDRLPRWGPDEEFIDDLESNKYVATVGYTANTFPSGGRDSGLPQSTAVLMNIMFVIILGIIE